jgi:hypothetical protein
MATPSLHETIQPREAAAKWRWPWWVQPVLVVTVLSVFGAYATWAAYTGEHYHVDPYLSPLYSPLLPSPFPWLSPAFLILWIPLGFRGTCYYYRKAYYRSFFWDPPGCAKTDLDIAHPHTKRYEGEGVFPWFLNNFHRYFLYVTTIVVAFLWYDAFLALFFPAPGGGREFGIGLGTVVLFLNVIMLSAYTFGCHSFRHFVGGDLDCFSRDSSTNLRHGIWKQVTWLNERHMLFAWISLFTVWGTDVFVRLLSMGVIGDVRLI